MTDRVASSAANEGAKPEVRLTLEHIGVATDNLGSVLHKLSKIFTSPPSAAEEVAGEGVRVAFIDVGGLRLEFLQSVRHNSAIARFLRHRSPGVHHLSFRVEGIDLKTWYERLESQGVRVIGDGPTEGSGGDQVFFVHPESTGGLLLEFSQTRREGPRE